MAEGKERKEALIPWAGSVILYVTSLLQLLIHSDIWLPSSFLALGKSMTADLDLFWEIIFPPT